MKEITQAIIAVSKEVNNIEKKMTVGTGSSSYKAVSDSMVRSEIKKAMGENGLVIVPTGVTAKTQTDRWEETTQYGTKMKQSVFTDVHTKYLLIHSSGESIEIAGYGQGVDSQDKGAGKATTYALKNTLLDLFLVIKGEDTDTDSTHSNDIPVPPTKAKPLTPEEAFEKAKQAIKDCKSIKECTDLEKRIHTSTVLGESNKIDLAFELQAKILTFDPTSDQ
jgi:hypothetical protein